MEGYCQNPECGEPIQWSGKERRYCHRAACRQRMSRSKRKQQALEELYSRWHYFVPEVVKELEAVLQGYGLRAAQIATDAVECQFKAVIPRNGVQGPKER